ncbi:unnamed protein product [Brassicogethes aeneus]|uniref:FAM13A-like domain-containing protein n=1 Tax=Brassicogethes aeneus TaxID=1431903 RepID=A0A9P0B4I0_BRAAE|nr:unnamed protein product [Brassicogethes aeneus]
MKGPAKKEETKKVPTRIDNESKAGKIKKALSSCISSKTYLAPTTYDEAKATCKARKRKERQESISSLCQDRKVIRSNSEERPAQRKYIEKKDNIRRVSSSEDFKKSASIEKINVSPSRYSSNEKAMAYEDYEYEKRRSHERFSRPLALKSKRTHPNKRLKVRYITRAKFKPEVDQTKENHKYDLDLNHTENAESPQISKFLSSLQNPETEDEDRAPSPITSPISPVLDLKTLHEQIDCSEPALSNCNQKPDDEPQSPSISLASNRLLLSPRNSIIATHRIYLDKDVPQIKMTLDNKPKNPVDERMQKLSKDINALKRKIKKKEVEFENKNGFKPSHVDKLNDGSMKKLYAELTKLKKEQRQLTEVSDSCCLIQGDNGKEDKVNIKETIMDLEKKLTLKRESVNRSHHIEDMTPEQLVEEKVAIQKALLYLESLYGRPNNKEDRDIVRPFYDRYRTLKRMVAKVSTQASLELATIHEDETMHFITPLPTQSENEEDKPKVSTSSSTDSDTDVSSISENYHSLTIDELLSELKLVTEEKKELRRTIKVFESSLQLKTGKMILKEDKVPMEYVYHSYKKAKAKLRLLEALVGKQN